MSELVNRASTHERRVALSEQDPSRLQTASCEKDILAELYVGQGATPPRAPRGLVVGWIRRVVSRFWCILMHEFNKPTLALRSSVGI